MKPCLQCGVQHERRGDYCIECYRNRNAAFAAQRARAKAATPADLTLTCERCGEQFTAKKRTARFCVPCRKVVKSERYAEWMQQWKEEHYGISYTRGRYLGVN